MSGAECPDLADPLLARVVSEHSLNASFTSNGQKELSEDEKKSSLAIEQRLRRMKKHPHRDKQCSVWSTWRDTDYPCESIFLLYDYRKNNVSRLDSSIITGEEIASCLALQEEVLANTLYILYYHLPQTITLRVPTVADAGFNNSKFLPKQPSDQHGKTRTQHPCNEGVHANCDLKRLQYVEIIRPIKKKRLAS